MTSEALFRDHLDLLERIVQTVCRRNGWDPDDIEDFASHVKVKLIDDDYAVLRKFEGRARLATFLTTVVQNLFLDYRIARWGKWRPSAAAQRLGPSAMRVETLVVRDGHSAGEAVQILADRGHELTEADVEGVLAQVPRRVQRRFDGDAALETLGTLDRVESLVEQDERSQVHQRVRSALRSGFAALSKEDQTLVRLRFEEGVTVARIAKMMRLDQKPLYRRLEKALATLRANFDGNDVRLSDVSELFGWEELDEDFSDFLD